VPPPEEPQEEENYGEPEPGPPTPLPPQNRHRPNMPGRLPEGFNQPQQQVQPLPDNSGDNSQPNGAKTPEQLMQELQQMQQQQQQMQDQLNPANRQDQEILVKHLEDFFFGTGAALPPGYVPPRSKD